jgi:hypothetical protein
MTPGYYILKAIMPSRSTPIVGYYTSELIPILNPIAANLELECNQLLTQLEQLCNLEQRPSHRSSSQQPIELMEEFVGPIGVQQT